MKTTRRNAIFGSVATAGAMSAAGQTLSGCADAKVPENGKLTKLTVLGAIHSRHVGSRDFSLDVLADAIRRANPDVVLSEIPADRMAAAQRGFDETGEVTEERAKVFPEVTQVLFPLSKEMGFRIAGCAGWTQAIARERSRALRAIEADPDRANQWAAHEEARTQYSREIAGRGDDPRFIHTLEYDVAVQRAQTPYQVFFDRDLGAGGWTQINRAHTDLIAATLNSISGEGLSALVLFGAWHKYMIERALGARGDIEWQSAAELFA